MYGGQRVVEEVARQLTESSGERRVPPCCKEAHFPVKLAQRGRQEIQGKSKMRTNERLILGFCASGTYMETEGKSPAS